MIFPVLKKKTLTTNGRYHTLAYLRGDSDPEFSKFHSAQMCSLMVEEDEYDLVIDSPDCYVSAAVTICIPETSWCLLVG